MAAIVERGNGAPTVIYQRATGSSKIDDPPWEGEEVMSMLSHCHAPFWTTCWRSSMFAQHRCYRTIE